MGPYTYYYGGTLILTRLPDWGNPIPAVITEFNNLVISGGSVEAVPNMKVYGNLTINSGATFDCAGNALTLQGNLVNNGTFTAGTVNVTLSGSNTPQTISGASTTTFYDLTISKSSLSNIVEAQSVISVGHVLGLFTGTFKLSSASTTQVCPSGTTFSIRSGSAFWNNGGTITGGGTTWVIQNGGLFRSSAGTTNIGNVSDVVLMYQNGAAITIEGGTVNVAASIRPSATSGVGVTYNQSGGIVNLTTQGNTSPDYSNLDIRAGSSFTMSGGSIVFQDHSTTYECRNMPSTYNVTGGTIQIGDAAHSGVSAGFITNVPVYNLVVFPTCFASVITYNLDVLNDVTIGSGATFNPNSNNITVGGDWTNNGTLSAASQTVTFNGTSPQTINGTSPAFNNLFISGSGGTTLGLSLSIAGNLTVDGTTFTLGSYTCNRSTTDGTFSIGNSSTLRIGGTNTLPSNFSVHAVGATSTIEYFGTDQSIAALNNSQHYGTLLLSGSGTKTFAGNTTIDAGLSIAGGVVADLGTGQSHITPSLKLNGVYQSTGSWGGTGSGAANLNTTYFAASTGILTNNPGCTAGTWLGTTSTDWNTASNWCGGVPTLSTDVTIPSGAPRFPILAGSTGFCRNLTISSGASLAISNGITLILTGNWANDGTFTANTGIVSFNGNSALQTISGTSTSTFYNLNVSKGDISYIVEAVSVVSLSHALNLFTGTFKLSSASATPVCPSGTTFSIRSGCAFWNNGGTITGGNTTWEILNGGLFRNSAGTTNIGNVSDVVLMYQNGAAITIEGGTVNVAGAIRPSATSGIGVTYNQSGGVLNAGTIGNTSPDYSNFDIRAGSSFTMSGGSIVFQNHSTAYEYLNMPSTYNVTGGTIQIWDAWHSGFSAGFVTNVPVYNLVVYLNSSMTLITNDLVVLNDVTIGSGATLNPLSHNISVGGDWTNNGTLSAASQTVTFNGTSPQIITGTSPAFNNLFISGSGGTTLGLNLGIAGNLTVDGTTFTLGSFTCDRSTAGGTLTIGNGSTVRIGGTNSLPSNFSAHSIGSSSLIEYFGTGQSIAALNSTQHYGNLLLTGSGTKTFAGNTTTDGNLSIASGVAADLGTGLTHSCQTLKLNEAYQVTGSWGGTGSGATNINTTYFAASTGILTNNPGCTAGTWLGTASTDWNDDVNWCGGKPTSATDVVIPAGLSNYPVIGASGGVCRNLTINSGASLAISGSNSLSVAGTWSNSGTFTANSSTVNFSGSSSQYIYGSSTVFNNLVIGGPGHWVTLGNNITVSGDLTISSYLRTSGFTCDRATNGGTINITNSGILTIGGTGTFPSNYATHVLAANSMLSYAGSNQIVTNESYGLLGLGGSGVKTMPATTMTVSNFRMDGGSSTALAPINVTYDVILYGGTFNAGSYTMTVGRTWINSGGNFNGQTGTVSFSSSLTQSIQGTTPTTFANLTFSGTGTKSYSLNTTITGTLSIASGTVVNLGTGLTHTSLTLKLNNLYQVTGSWGGTGSGATNINTTYFAATSGILNNNPGCTAGTWLGTTGTDWNDATNWCGGIPASSTDVVIPSGLTNYPVIGASGGVCQNLTINSGASLAISGTNSLSISGTWTNNGAFTANSSTVAFNGSSQQNIYGSSTVFNNLVISNSANWVILSDHVSVSGDLTISHLFDMGNHTCNRTTNGGTLTVNNGSTLRIGGTNTLPSNFSTHSIGSTSIIAYVGTTQSIAALNSSQHYGNLSLNGSDTKTFAGNTTTDGILSIASGTVADLGTGLTHSCLKLKLNNLYQVTGSWGGTGSGATNINTTYFATSTGILFNNPGCTAGTWLGITSTDWNDATNWCGGVPTSTTDVIIPSGVTNFPYIRVSSNVCRNLTINSGASLTMDPSISFRVYGNWTNNGTFNAIGGDVTFPGTSVISGSTTTFFSLIINGNTTLGVNTTVQGNLQVAGSLDLGAYTCNRTTNGWGINITGTLLIGGTNSFPSNYATHTFSPTSTVNYNGSNQTVANESYGNLTLSGSGIKTLPASTLNIGKDFTMSGTCTATAAGIINCSYKVTLGSGTTFNAGSFIHTVGTDWVNNGGTFNAGTGTINFFGTSSQSISGTASTTFNNLAFNGNGIKSLGTNTTVNGTLTIAGGSTLFLGTYNLGNPSGLLLECGTTAGSLISGTGTLSLGGNINVTNAGTGAYGPVISCPVSLNATRTFTIADAPTAAVDLSITGIIDGIGVGIIKEGTGTFTLSGANTFSAGITLNAGQTNINHASAPGTGTFTIFGGTIDNTSGSPITLVNNNDLRWTGNFIFSGTNDLNLGTGNVTMSNIGITVSAGIMTVGGVIPSYSNLIKSGNGTLAFVNNQVNLTNLTINAGTLVASSGSMYLLGNFTNNGTFNHNGGRIGFNGLNPQSIGGSVASTFNNLLLNNGSTGLTLNNVNATVIGILTLSNSKIITGTNMLTMGAAASATGAGSLKYVYGNLRWEIPAGNPVRTFFIGDPASYTPVTVTFSGITTGGYLTGSTSAGDHASISTANINANKSVNRTWTFTNNGIDPANYNIAFSYVNGDDDAGTTPSSYILGKWNGSSWSYPAVAGVPTLTSLSATGLSGFSSFQIGEFALAPDCTAGGLSNKEACTGSSTSFTASCVAFPQPASVWEYNDGINGWQTLTISSPYSKTDNWTLATNTVTSTLTIDPATTGLSGYQYRVSFTNLQGSCTTNAATLTVNPLPVCSITGNDPVCPNSTGNIYTAPAGMSSYAWSISGNGTIQGAANTRTVTVNAGSVCDASFTLTLVIINDKGCTSTCQKEVTVKVTGDFTMPGNDGKTVACISLAVPPTVPTVTDNCGAVLTPSGPGIGGTYDGCEGTKTYIYTYTDCEGNHHDWVYTYTIEREDFTMPENDGETVACIGLAVEPTLPDVTDNCGLALIPTGPVAGGTYDGCEGTKTFTYTYTDCEGNHHDWVYTYTIEREDFTMPENDGETVACIGLAVEPTLPDVTDNCGLALIPTGPIAGGTYDGCEGTKTFTYTYTDCEGNHHDWVYTYTIEREDFTMPENDGETVACIGLAVEPTLPDVTDNCGLALIPTGPVTGGTYVDCEGTKTYTYTYTDCEGNHHDWVYTYTIEREDFTMPENDGETVACIGLAVEPTLPDVTDNCGLALIPTGPVAGGTYDGCEGTKTFTYTYTDCENNHHDWVYTYTIEREDFTMPENDGETVACISLAVTPELPEVTDNCGLALIPTGPIAGGTYVDCEGTKTYTYTYTDCEGNHHDWVYTYTIEREDFTMPENDGETVACISLAVTPELPEVTDNCGTVLIPTGPVTGGTYDGCEGTKTFTYTYTDCENNHHDWVYTYTIEREDFTMPENDGETVACISLAVTPELPEVTDNCGLALIPTGFVTGGTYDGCEGTKTFTYTYTDCENNHNDWVYTYTIEREDFTMPENDGETVACIGLAVEPTLPDVTDNCGLALIPTGPVTGGTYVDCEGTKTYTYTYTDCEGNHHDWVYTYTIEREDFTMPENDGETVACIGLAVEPTLPDVTDNCGLALIPTGPVAGGTYDGCEGTKTFTYTYTDCENNHHDWVYTYTIEREDFTMPENDGETVACISLAVTPELPEVTDNCGLALIPTGPIAGGTYVDCEGTKTYTYTYTDCEGNHHDWVYTYTIEREDFTMPENDGETVACIGLAVEPTLPDVTDNCGLALIPTGPIAGGTYDGCEGTKTFTYTYTDCENNHHDWVYTYTIEREDFTMPENDGETVACISLAVTPELPEVTDNCGLALIPTGPIAGGTYDGCEGTKTFTYTYTDCENNHHDWVYTYTIDDNVNPTVTCPGNQQRSTPGGSYTTIGTEFDPTYGDNCAVTSVTNNLNQSSSLNGYIFPIGETGVTWTVKDCAGNTAECSFTVTAISGLAISGTLKYYKQTTANLPMNNVYLALMNGPDTVSRSVTNSSGEYTFNHIVNGSYSIKIVRNNKPAGGINATDAALINWWPTHLTGIEPVKYMAGDVQNDYWMQSTDAYMVQQYFILGLPFARTTSAGTPWSYFKSSGNIILSNTVPYNGASQWPTEMDLEVAGSSLSYDILSLVNGDFNSSFMPGGAKGGSSVIIEDGNFMQAKAGTEITIPVRIMDAGRVGAISLILNFPSELVDVSDVTMQGVSDPVDWAVNGNELRIGWNSRNPLTFAAGDAVVNLRLTTASTFTAGNVIRFTVASDPLNELADNYYNVIPDAVLTMDVIQASTIGIDEQEAVKGLSLSNHPNPFSGVSEITYMLPHDGQVTLTLCNIVGQEVKVLVNEAEAKGDHSLRLEAWSLEAGVYTATLTLKTADGQMVKTIKLVKTK